MSALLHFGFEVGRRMMSSWLGEALNDVADSLH